MTAPPAPSSAELTVPVEEVRSAAAELGITTPLRRLTAEGLIAAPRSRGRGRGRGREYSYPARVLGQLAALAEAMGRSHRFDTLRHLLWWNPQGQLEDWPLWQRDRLAEIALEARRWTTPAALDDEFPEEREQHVIEVAVGWRNARMRGLPRKRLHTLDDTVSFVRLWTSALLKDDWLVPVNSDGAEEHWRGVAARPVDTDEDGPVGGTLGELFDRGVGWPSDGPGFGALAWAACIPTPVGVAATLVPMTEERATSLRDAILAAAACTGSEGLLRESPVLAAMALAMMDRLDARRPGILEHPAAV